MEKVKEKGTIFIDQEKHGEEGKKERIKGKKKRKKYC